MEEDATGNTIKFTERNPDHKIGTCSDCGEEMIHNVPRLGAAGGFVHKKTGNYLCFQQINPILRSCVDCIHFKRIEPHTWGECAYPLPWWIHKTSPIIHPVENNAVICKCFSSEKPITVKS